MKRKSSTLKSMARGTLQGKWGTAVGACFLVSLIVGTIPIIINFFNTSGGNQNLGNTLIFQGISLIFSLISYVFAAGIIRLMLNMIRGRAYSLGDIFSGFKQHPDRFIFAALLVGLITIIPLLPATLIFVLGITLASRNIPLLLLSILCFILGMVFTVIISLRYAMVNFLLIEDATLGVRAALKSSVELMKGNKGRYFYMILSFIGWGIVNLFTLGLGTLWLVPYQNATYVYFFLDVIGELDGHALSKKQSSYANPTEYFQPNANPYQNNYEKPYEDPFKYQQNPYQNNQQDPYQNNQQNPYYNNQQDSYQSDNQQNSFDSTQSDSYPDSFNDPYRRTQEVSIEDSSSDSSKSETLTDGLENKDSNSLF